MSVDGALAEFGFFFQRIDDRTPLFVGRNRRSVWWSRSISEEVKRMGIVQRGGICGDRGIVLFLVLLCLYGLWPSDVILVGEEYRYDDAGRLVSVSYGEGVEIAYSYDSRGNLLSRTITDPADADRDLLDDAWEEEFFDGTQRDGNGDFDLDGQSDLAEFLAGTNPTDPTSLFRFVGIQSSPEGGVSVSWQSVEGLNYQLQSRDSLAEGEWLDIGPVVVGNGSSASASDDRPSAGDGARVYRVVVLPEGKGRLIWI